MYGQIAFGQATILIILCLLLWAWIVYRSLTMSPDTGSESYPDMTDFEARSRGLATSRDDDRNAGGSRDDSVRLVLGLHRGGHVLLPDLHTRQVHRCQTP